VILGHVRSPTTPTEPCEGWTKWENTLSRSSPGPQKLKWCGHRRSMSRRKEVGLCCRSNRSKTPSEPSNVHLERGCFGRVAHFGKQPGARTRTTFDGYRRPCEEACADLASGAPQTPSITPNPTTPCARSARCRLLDKRSRRGTPKAWWRCGTGSRRRPPFRAWSAHRRIPDYHEIELITSCLENLV
jgi:hypothetical protein